MVIKSPSSNSVFDTKNIDCIGFEIKLDKNNKPIKRNGKILIDKTKIHIMFASGQGINVLCANEEQGQQMFDIISNAMQGIVFNK
jgi:hypothetical protein